MKARRDICAEITATIVAQLEAADPQAWECPWTRCTASGLPSNATTGKAYRGVNVLQLWCAQTAAGHEAPLWASYKQWEAAGAQVRKGERGTAVVYYGSTSRHEPSHPRADDDGNVAFRFLKWSTVFNASQVDGYEIAQPERPALVDRLDAAERFVAATGATLHHGGGRAFYRHAPADEIHMPEPERFAGSATSSATEAYYGTLLHELTHWTGAKHRCDRTKGRRFGDSAYAFEELVAELGAAFLCAHLQITASPRPDHAQYLASWLRGLKDDSRAIFKAAALAAQALDFLTALQPAAPVAIAAQ